VCAYVYIYIYVCVCVYCLWLPATRSPPLVNHTRQPRFFSHFRFSVQRASVRYLAPTSLYPTPNFSSSARAKQLITYHTVQPEGPTFGVSSKICLRLLDVVRTYSSVDSINEYGFTKPQYLLYHYLQCAVWKKIYRISGTLFPNEIFPTLSVSSIVA